MPSRQSSGLQFHLFTLVLCLTAIVGDITPTDGVSKKEKTYLEKTALDEMCEVLGGGPAGIFHSVVCT